MLFAAIQEHGQEWDESRTLREQREWAAHAEFMDALADEGFIVLGGPLGDERALMIDRALLIIEADSEATVRRRLEPDPWIQMGALKVGSVQPWVILLGDPKRLAAS
jgi:uncharacterized protein YciI